MKRLNTDFLIEYMDRIAVGGVAVIIIVYLVLVAMSASPGAEQINKAQDIIESIDKNIADAHPPKRVSSRYEEQLDAPFNSAPKPGRGVKWVAYKYPFVTREYTPTTPPRGVHSEPILSPQSKDIGSVKLKWRPGENKHITITMFVLQRRESEEDVWKPLGKELPPETRRYEDTDVMPDSEYHYRLVSFAEAANENVIFPESEKIKYSAPLVVETPSNIEITTTPMLTGDAVFLSVDILLPDGSKKHDSAAFKKGEEIILFKKRFPNNPDKWLKTGWKVKEFGKEKGKTTPYVIITNEEDKAKQFPPQK